MNTFCQKHTEKITGVLSCPDRVLFKGHLPLNYPAAMERFLTSQGLLLKDFKSFCAQESERVKQHAVTMCKRLDRPYVYLNRFERKEDYVCKLLAAHPVAEGLICVLATNEACGSFKLRYGEGRPHLTYSQPKCLCLYYYFLDREFGKMHVRIQTWFPFTIQIYVNGHEWLCRKLAHHGVAYTSQDNALTWVSDPARAQRFANSFVKRPWPRLLEAFGRKVNPLFKDLLASMSYYWVADQFEYATDVMFKDRASLKHLYPELLRHATLCLSAEDVLTFLGRKLNGNFKGEVLTEAKKRQPGARVKHRVGENWIKMYDKFGSVLRIETVINHPYDFRVRRKGIRNGEEVTGWYPMAKGVANLPRYAEVCAAANERYLQALACVDDPSEALDELAKLTQPVRKGKAVHRALNPFSQKDLALFRAVLRGEHTIKGLCNRDIRLQLYGHQKDTKKRQRHSAAVSRQLRLLHAHRLIAKIPHSHRWRITERGMRLLAAILRLHTQEYPKKALKEAA